MVDHEDSESTCDLLVSSTNIWLMVYSYQRNSIVWHVWGISFNISEHIGGLISSIIIRLAFNGFIYSLWLNVKDSYEKHCFLYIYESISTKSFFSTSWHYPHEVVQIKKFYYLLWSSRESCWNNSFDNQEKDQHLDIIKEKLFKTQSRYCLDLHIIKKALFRWQNLMFKGGKKNF